MDIYQSSDEHLSQKTDNVYDSFFQYIETEIKNKAITNYEQIDDEYRCYVYSYGNLVSWKKMISEIIDSAIDESFFYTKYPSFIIIMKVKDDLYCATGGLANHLISDFKDKMFGVNLICKIVEPTDQIIRYVLEKRVYGRINSSRISNRTTSNFVNERNYRSIFHEFGTVIENQVQEKLGIKPQVDSEGNEVSKDIFINFGATIHIGKQTTFVELKEIIIKIATLMDESVPFLFVINFLIPVNRAGIKQNEVFDDFYTHIIDNPSEINVGYNYEINKLVCLDKLRNSSNSTVKQKFIEKYSLNSLNDINDLKKLLINYITQEKSVGIIKNYYFQFEQNEYDRNKVKIKDLLDQEFSYKSNNQLYLIEGTWYKFLEDYIVFLDNEYKTFFDLSKEKCDLLFGEKYINLDVRSFRIENDLKKEINKRNNLIDCDMKYIKSIEIADAIYLENNNIYFLHNKSKFDGCGVRDLTGQINSSSNLVLGIRTRDPELNKEFINYIKKLKNKNPNKHQLIDKFSNLLRNSSTNIIYIASFTDEVTIDTGSSYIKYLLYITKTQLDSNNFDFYLN